MTITDVSDAERMHREQEVLGRYFPDFELVRSKSTGKYAARGVLSTHLNLYGIRIVLPTNYPYGMPDIEPVGWQPSGPHTYGSNSLCVMRHEQWRNSYSVALVVAKAAIWVNKYEIYRKDGKWPGNEQLHGLAAMRQSLTEFWNSL
jgi:hypothetical protein